MQWSGSCTKTIRFDVTDSLLAQTPFTLTLRLWDVYMLEGEKVLSAFAYTALKLHKSE